MMNRAELAAAIRADRKTWRDLCDAVGVHRMNEPGPMGEWTFGDMAGHLAAWRNKTIRRLECAARGEPDPGDPWPRDLEDDDAVNEWFHRKDEGRSADEMVADYDSSFERLAAVIEALPEAAITDPNAFEWTGGTALGDIDFRDHLHQEHIPAVNRWLEEHGRAA
jgi:hypothetical protein